MSTNHYPPLRGAPPRYVSIAEAAQYLGVTSHTVRNYLAKRHFPAYRIRGRRGLHVDLNEVDRWAYFVPPTIARPHGPTYGGARIVELPHRPVVIRTSENDR